MRTIGIRENRIGYEYEKGDNFEKECRKKLRQLDIERAEFRKLPPEIKEERRDEYWERLDKWDALVNLFVVMGWEL